MDLSNLPNHLCGYSPVEANAQSLDLSVIGSHACGLWPQGRAGLYSSCPISCPVGAQSPAQGQGPPARCGRLQSSSPKYYRPTEST